MISYLVIVLTAFAAGLIQALTGLGAAAVMMVVLPWYFTMLQAPAICQMICIALSVSMLIKLRRSVNLRFALPPTIIYTLMSVISIRFVKGLNLGLLNALFGVFLLLLAVWFFFFEGRVKVPSGTGSMAACSAFSGVLGGVFGVGGPTMALWFLAAADDRLVYLASLQVLFTASNILSTVTRAANGILTWDLVPPALAGMVGILAGQRLGMRYSDRLKPEYFRKGVYLCVGLSGLIQLLNQIL